ncbi:MAG: protein kinase domain-containing protein [Gemmatimonadota bacterium]
MTSDRVERSGIDERSFERLRLGLSSSYDVLESAGSGGSSIVFRALDRRHGRYVAIKVLRPAIGTIVGPTRFRREIEVAARLSHPNIVPLFDSGETEGLLWYVMPFVDGHSLRRLLQEEGALPLDRAIRISRDVARGLQYAHDHGVIHRDIKPENILLTSEGSAMVTDFGLARALEGVVTEHTAEGLAIGTSWYMSPEQASAERVDGRSDQYGLACVLYEMLAGDPPFQGRTAQNIAARHRGDPRPHVRHVRDSVPVSIDAVIQRGLATLPADRFTSVAEFAAALEGALSAEMRGRMISGNLPLQVGPESAPLRSRLTPRLVVVAVLALTAFGLWRFRDRLAGSPELDTDLVAIAPFDVLGVADTVWRHGMVDLLYRNFDGAGPLRAVAPSVVVRNFNGRGDRPSALALARRTGAGLVLQGQLTIAGPDRVRLQAWLLDARTGSEVGSPFDGAEQSVYVPRLADSLTVHALSVLGATRPIAATPGRGLGSTSMQALKAFLLGEQLLRRNEYESAGDKYQEAVAIDSGFALAYHGLRQVRRALGQENDSLSRLYAERAGRLNRHMRPADSLRLLADSLSASFPTGSAFYDSVTIGRLERLHDALLRLVERQPLDASALAELGELYVHYGYRLGIAQDSALSTLERAIATDPNFAPGYGHAIELALTFRERDSVRVLADRYLNARPSDYRYQLLRGLLAEDGAVRRRTEQRITQLGADSALRVALLTRRLRDRGETALKIYRSVLNSEPPGNSYAAQARTFLQFYLLQLGKLDEAWRVRDGVMFSVVPMNLGTFVRFGIAPDDSTRAMTREKAALGSALDYHAAVVAAAFLGDTVALANPGTVERSATSIIRDYADNARAAWLQLARRDTAGAIARFQQLPLAGCHWTCWPEIEVLATLMARRGDPEAAARILDRRPPPNDAGAFLEHPWLSLRLAVAQKLGDTLTVSRWRRVLDDLRLHADSTVLRRLDSTILP